MRVSRGEHVYVEIVTVFSGISLMHPSRVVSHAARKLPTVEAPVLYKVPPTHQPFVSTAENSSIFAPHLLTLFHSVSPFTKEDLANYIKRLIVWTLSG